MVRTTVEPALPKLTLIGTKHPIHAEYVIDLDDIFLPFFGGLGFVID